MKLAEYIDKAISENEDRQDNLTLDEQNDIEEALRKAKEIIWGANDRKMDWEEHVNEVYESYGINTHSTDVGVRDNDF